MKIQGGSVSFLWLVWILGSCAGCAVLANVLFNGADKTVFMPGPLSDGHHQLSGSCDSCHTDAFGDGAVLQQSCIDCHGDVREKPFDSHPKAKFSDPRNADLLSTIDATQCVTCHVEHKPEITLTNGLTQPKDLCFHCHQTIAEDRPSHVGMGYETCASSGCHNFHDNRALYTDFLAKRIGDPANLEIQRMPSKEFVEMLDMLIDYPRDDYPVEVLNIAQADVPDSVPVDIAIIKQWSESGHAQHGANCSACHVTSDEVTSSEIDTHVVSSVANEAADHWTNTPGIEGCASCHEMETKTFTQGKHGMRLQADLPPMTPADARLPMNEEVSHEELTCNSCHEAHDYDVTVAAVESCVGCHADEHTSAYKNSKHYALWLAEIEGEGEPGTGVSCATCHMPRVSMDVDDYNSRIVVDHNQSATLSPNSKMLRPACLECHGMEFSLNALADVSLINNNFLEQPTVEVKSMAMVRDLRDAHEKRKQAN